LGEAVGGALGDDAQVGPVGAFGVGRRLVDGNPAVEAGSRRLASLLREAGREALAMGRLIEEAAEVGKSGPGRDG
jgi:hypothetical protein